MNGGGNPWGELPIPSGVTITLKDALMLYAQGRLTRPGILRLGQIEDTASLRRELKEHGIPAPYLTLDPARDPWTARKRRTRRRTA